MEGVGLPDDGLCPLADITAPGLCLSHVAPNCPKVLAASPRLILRMKILFLLRCSPDTCRSKAQVLGEKLGPEACVPRLYEKPDPKS